MAGEDMIMADPGEIKRLHVIRKVLERAIKQVEAAEIRALALHALDTVGGGIEHIAPLAACHRVPVRLAQERLGLPGKFFKGLGIDFARNDAPFLHCRRVRRKRSLELNSPRQQVGLLFPLRHRLPLCGHDGNGEAHHDHGQHHEEIGGAPFPFEGPAHAFYDSHGDARAQWPRASFVCAGVATFV